MTAKAISSRFEPIGQLLKANEYDALPENSRREFVDGVVHITVSPTPWHQLIADLLTVKLMRLVPSHLRVIRQIEVRVDDLTRRNPDVLVVSANGFDRMAPRLRPDQVILAVEVVDRGCETADRVVKPNEYAWAEIPHYWRIETDPDVVIYTYQLTKGPKYLHTGTFAVGETVAAAGLEWVSVEVAELSEED